MQQGIFVLFISVIAITHAQEDLTFTTQPDGTGIIIKGFVNNVCIGHAALDPRDYPTGSIDELLVHAEHRNQGFGQALLQKAIQFFEDKQYANIHLQVSPFSCRPRLEQKDLIRFYAKEGFRSLNNLEMIKDLGRTTVFNQVIKKRSYISAVVAAPALSILRYKTHSLSIKK